MYHSWRAGNWDDFDDEKNWNAFDRIVWRFAPGWRNRYREVPLLANVTN